jgi:hypothetical protein
VLFLFSKEQLVNEADLRAGHFAARLYKTLILFKKRSLARNRRGEEKLELLSLADVVPREQICLVYLWHFTLPGQMVASLPLATLERHFVASFRSLDTFGF